MNWQAIGAIGEFIGSLAVLITLIYLAIQVKHARTESRAELLQHRSDASRQLWLADLAHPHVLKAFIHANEQLGSPPPRAVQRIMEATDLDAVDAWAIMNRCAANFYHRQTMFLSNLTEDEREVLDRQMTNMFASGVNRIYLEAIYESEKVGRGSFDGRFVEHVYRLATDDGDA